MEVALYRKYRPNKFSEVLGQEHIVSVLEGAIKEGNVSHAYLFAGSRGTGKTSIARIFSEAIGTSANDLYEIDAASNRGIDDIRELREAVNILPLESERKVYLIDEVHMLTKEAFNALLKTLEEPPKHAVFILATTELERLPDTIVSRCQTFTFKKPSREVLRDMVVKVAKQEGFTLERSSADLIALLSEGSFRDAHGILQKIITSSSDKKISVDEVEQITGAPKGELVNEIAESLSSKDLEKGLIAVNKAVEQNIDVRVLMKLLLEKVRAILLLSHAPKMEESMKEKFTAEDLKFLVELSKNKQINSNDLKELLDAYTATRFAYIQQLPLELALVKIISHNSD